MKLFCRFLSGSWSRIVALAILGSGASFCGVYLALVSKKVVDIATGQTEGDFISQGLILGMIILLQLVLQIALTSLHVRTVTSLRFKIQSRVFESYMRKQKLSADKFHSGELVNRISGDSSIVASGAADLFPSIFSISTRIVLSFCALLVLDRTMAVACVLAGMLMMVAAQFYRKMTGVLFRESRESEGRMRSFIQETVQNLTVIKAFSVYSIVNRQLGKLQDDAFSLAIKKNRVSIGIHVCFFTVMTAGYYLALGWGAWRIYSGAMTFGTLTAILTLTGDVTTPFKQIAGMFPQYMSMKTSAERLDELEMLPEDEILPAVDAIKAYDDFLELRLSDISFSYGDGDVLKDVNVSFAKNTMTAVVGESGAGKSTLLNIISGLLKPDFGEIVMETKSGTTHMKSSHREMFACVPQDFLLLSGDVLENITLFDQNPDMDRFWLSVRMAELGEVIEKLPSKIHTHIGEGGSRLSGGQRQRMALARALYSKAGILLLDEATSALSTTTEEQIIKNLRESDRTVIFVTHRKTASNFCDEVVRIKDGHIELSEINQNKD